MRGGFAPIRPYHGSGSLAFPETRQRYFRAALSSFSALAGISSRFG
jgi:hypothetical protein